MGKGKRIIRTLYEHIYQSDDGCMVADHCLECPLPACLLDDGSQLYRIEVKRLMEQVRGLRHEEAARRLGVSVRTIMRMRKVATA